MDSFELCDSILFHIIIQSTCPSASLQVNLDGEVVGMSVFRAAAAEGVSFAVPIDTVSESQSSSHL